MITISLQDLKLEFSAEPVLRAEEVATRKTLGKLGATVRKIARNSIKTRGDNEHAPPGEPPIGHNGNPRYKDWIFYYVDRSPKEVVIGPLLLPRKDSQIVPETLEYGGEVPVPTSHKPNAPKVLVRQEARPHMRPALDKAVEKYLPAMLENSIVPT